MARFFIVSSKSSSVGSWFIYFKIDAYKQTEVSKHNIYPILIYFIS